MQAGLWLWTDYPLLAEEMEVAAGPAGQCLRAPPLTHRTETEAVLPLTIFRAGSSWPQGSAQVVYLDEVAPSDVTGGAGLVYRRRTRSGEPLRIGERRYEHGITFATGSAVAFDLTGRGERLFRAEVSVDATRGNLMQDSPDRLLLFQVLLEWGFAGVYANWCDARLVRG